MLLRNNGKAKIANLRRYLEVFLALFDRINREKYKRKIIIKKFHYICRKIVSKI
jgi:hypothetical protein